MTYQFPSKEWLHALKDKLNADEKYGKTASNWEGAISFHLEAGGPIQEDLFYYIDLWHGECREVQELTNEADLKALNPAFVLSAPYPSFVRVLKGQLDPMQAMVTRKLKVQGSMGYMMRNVPTVLEFVRCAKEIQTNFL